MSLGLLGVAGGLVVFDRQVAGSEAIVASNLIATVFADQTVALPARAVVVLHAADQRAFGLQITPECTSAFLLAPVVTIAALLCWLRPRQTRQFLKALAGAAVLLLATNQLRILGLVGLIENFGFADGYLWGHTVAGSLISILGVGAAVLAFVYLGIARRAQER